MNTTTLTIFFEAPFWVGVVERRTDGALRVCRTVFGAEPRDFEVLDFVRRTLPALSFSPAVEEDRPAAAESPKRRQRQAQKLLEGSGIGTKSQQALSAQRELRKQERKVRSREEKALEAQRRFQLRVYLKTPNVTGSEEFLR